VILEDGEEEEEEVADNTSMNQPIDLAFPQS
jgi:hypothetical protein